MQFCQEGLWLQIAELNNFDWTVTWFQAVTARMYTVGICQPKFQ